MSGFLPIATPVSPDALTQPVLAKDPGKTAEAALKFEGMLMANLFQTMRKTVSHNDLFGKGGSAQHTYEYLLDQATVTQAMEAGKGWGLSGKLQTAWDHKNPKVTATPE
jgi:Rod binding domain-containing protein